MGLLPCLRRGSDRWWLPRSETVTELVGQLMLASARGPVDARMLHHVEAVLAADPPLLIHTALQWEGERAGLDQLARWLAENATVRFASGDAFLGAPPIEQATTKRWSRLRDHFRTLPLDRWLDDAALWLEVLGPQVPNSWQHQWPSLTIEDDGENRSFENLLPDGLLHQLARSVQRIQSLEQSFDWRLHQSKMGALQQLAYGLSHEINNPLANISTRAQQLARGEEDPTRQAILQRIVDQVYRAHAMIADLMFYANPSDAQPSLCDLRPTIRQVVDSFCEEAERQSIRLEVETPDRPMTASVDRDMIGEAIRALIRNSVEAIGCQGTVVVSLLREADQIRIHVADSGPGLSPQARKHAFDPYFSGREAGRGLGLGLCRAYRIAKLHGGEIALAGGPAGCVATISLRAAE